MKFRPAEIMGSVSPPKDRCGGSRHRLSGPGSASCLLARVLCRLGLLAVLWGCSGHLPQTVGGRLQEEGYSKAYIKGYVEGCNAWKAQFSGKSYGSQRNEARLQAEPEYRNGWDEGYETCKDKDQPWNPALRAR